MGNPKPLTSCSHLAHNTLMPAATCACRHMHELNQPPLMHPFISAFQWLLLSTPVGRWVVNVSAVLAYC